jgi:maleamate amidohydrolase
MRADLTLDPRRTALLLVDFQEEQRSHPLYAVAGFPTVIDNAARLLDAARSSHLLVLHAAYRRDFALRPPRPFEPVSENGAPSFSVAGDPGTAICAELAPQSDELVIYKNDASAFCEGTLGPALDAASIEWVIVAGVWTDACVAATVRDGMAMGYRVLLVKDACGSGTRGMHQTAILTLANRLYGGAVTDTNRAVQLVAGNTVSVWTAERPVPILFELDTVSDRYSEL